MYLAIKTPQGKTRPLGFSDTRSGRESADELHDQTVRNTAICAGLQGLHLQEWLSVLLKAWVESELFQAEEESPEVERDEPARGVFVEVPVDPGLLDAVRCLRDARSIDVTLEDEIESLIHMSSLPSQVFEIQELHQQGVDPEAIASRLCEAWRSVDEQPLEADGKEPEFEGALRGGAFWHALRKSGVLQLARGGA